MDNTFTSNNLLAKRLLLKHLVPSVLSLLASSVNSLIDTAIVGNCLKDAGLQCMSVVAPVHLLYLTIGSTVCVGSAICFSQAIGENNVKKAKNFFGFAVFAVFALGLLFTALFTPFSYQIARLLGASGELVKPCADYLFYYFCGGAFVLAMYVPHNFSKALGKPNVPLILLAVMAVVNVFLTYLFVAVLDFGVGGASLATVIAIAVASVIGFFFVVAKDSPFNPSFFKLNIKESARALISGIASGANNFIRFLTVFGINSVITLFAASALLGTYSVARSVQELFNCVALGVSQAIAAIIAMFYSERDNKSVETVLKTAALTGLALIVGCVALTVFLSAPLARIFGKIPSPEDKSAIIFINVALIPAFMNCLMASYYTCVRKYVFSYIILAARVIFTLACAFAFTAVFGEKTLFLSFASGEILAFAVAMAAVKLFAARRKNLKRFFLLENKNDNLSNKTAFSLHPSQDEVMSVSEKLSAFLEERDVDIKSAMKSSLAVEEILMTVINKKMLGSDDYVYVSVFYDVDGVVMRFRYGGKKLNPFASLGDFSADDADFGLNVLKKSVKETEYIWSFGLNNLVVLI